jgi:predicted RNA-binding Zn-ribbon protein involved in translation (DUF1610 family)
MTTRARCPNCGGLVSADATWCGQCLTPLGGAAPTGAAPTGAPPNAPSPAPGPEPGSTPGTPSAPTPTERTPRGVAGDGRPPSSASRPIRPGADGVVWECPACGTENAIEVTTCRSCGTPFAKLLEDEAPGSRIDPRRAVTLSLVFPGLGHAAAGRGAEGLARAVVFAFSLIIAISILVSRSGGDLGPFLPLLLLSAAGSVGLYVLTAMDAGRLARGEPPLVATRVLLYGAAVLMLLQVALLVVLGTRTVGAGG